MSVHHVRASLMAALLSTCASSVLAPAVLAQEKADPTVLPPVAVTGERAEPSPTEVLAPVSTVTRSTMDLLQPGSSAGIFATMPGISSSGTGEDPSTVVNIRGLQDNGRVTVLVDGARQDFSRPTHAGYGSFYLDPDLVRAVSVLRGPNGSGVGGIGGTVAFETLRPSDLMRPGETWALSQKLGYESNGSALMSSTTGAVRLGDRFELLGNYVRRSNSSYEDGNGTTIRYTDQDPSSGLLKGVWRPAPGHQLMLNGTAYRNEYWASRQAGSGAATLSVDATTATNEAVTARWQYSQPGDRLFDLDATAYWTDTEVSQNKVRGTAATLGQTRGYEVSTRGASIANTSRFDGLGLRHAVTYGGDLTLTKGSTTDIAAGSGDFTQYGAYVQWQGDYSTWLQLIAAARYEHYEHEGRDQAGLDAQSSGGRVSPRFTVGITPVRGFTVYGTYAEGFRPPAIYEVFGIYASASNYMLGLDLKPETARNWEGGINVRYDDVFVANDALRAKFNVFHTDIDDYITGQNVGGVYQFRNIAAAQLRGVELDLSYDLGWSFFSFAGSLISAKREGGPYDGQPISTAPLDRLATTLGFRALDRQLTYGVQVLAIDATGRNTASFPTAPDAGGYGITNLFSTWQVTDAVALRLNVNNLFDRTYSDPQAQYTSTAPTAYQGPGRTVKASLTVRFGG